MERKHYFVIAIFISQIFGVITTVLNPPSYISGSGGFNDFRTNGYGGAFKQTESNETIIYDISFSTTINQIAPDINIIIIFSREIMDNLTIQPENTVFLEIIMNRSTGKTIELLKSDLPFKDEKELSCSTFSVNQITKQIVPSPIIMDYFLWKTRINRNYLAFYIITNHLLILSLVTGIYLFIRNILKERELYAKYSQENIVK
jgi:hypothetical protein